jgi:hypothetical protein
MTPDEASIALDSIAAEVRRIIEQPINPLVLTAASTAIGRHYLRALDAIQLGRAIVARDLLAARRRCASSHRTRICLKRPGRKGSMFGTLATRILQNLICRPEGQIKVHPHHVNDLFSILCQ